MLLRIVFTIIIGSIAGIIGGSTGIGGTFVLLPGLLFLNIIPDYKLAVGTILLSMLPPISILAVKDFYDRKKIDYTIAFFICVSYIISARYGAYLNKIYSVKTLNYATSLIFFLCFIYFLWKANYTKG